MLGNGQEGEDVTILNKRHPRHMKPHRRWRTLLAALVVVISMAVAPAAMADMNGIDISGYQAADIPSAVPADFVIVKATQGMWWSNNNYTLQLANADRTGKATGVYHFANGGNALSEADFFVNAVSARVGRSTLNLDWERCLAYGRYGCATVNPNWGNPNWIRQWVNRVHDRTRVWPAVYVQRSAVWQVPSDVRAHCMLWVAQYANSLPTGYQSSPWNGGASGEGMTQYASTGYLNGRGPLDLNRFYGDRSAWQKIACGERAGCTVGTVTTAPSTRTETTTTTTDLNALASAVIRGDFGNDPARRQALGSNYAAVMDIVNRRLSGSGVTTPSGNTGYCVVVSSGDTMGAIASRTGRTPASAWSVPSGNIDRIWPGQQVCYGGTTASSVGAHIVTTSHVVTAGESLWTIYGATGWQAAAQRNGLYTPYTIYPGQHLR